MNIYKLSQSKNESYATYDSAIVTAKDEEKARYLHPNGSIDWDGIDEKYSSWASAEDIDIELIGKAKKGTKEGVILASFNAG